MKYNTLKECSLASRYNICILRGFCVSDAFVRRDHCALSAPSILNLQAVTIVHLDVNSYCKIHSRIKSCPAKVCTTVELQPFERYPNIGLWETRWTARQIAAHVRLDLLVVFR